jgi:hypothetical protein
MMCNSTLNSISDSFPAFSITENDVSVFNGWLYKFFMKANIVLFNNIDESQIFTIICNYDINSLITSYSSEPTDKLDSFINKLENKSENQRGGYGKISNTFSKFSLSKNDTKDKLTIANNRFITILIKYLFFNMKVNNEKFIFNLKSFFYLRDNIFYFENIIAAQNFAMEFSNWVNK